MDPTTPTASTWVEVARANERRRSQEYALVLQAVGIPHGVAQDRGEFVLLVRAEDAESAADQLARYERENRGWPPREEAPAPISDGIQAALVYAGFIALFFVFSRRHSFDVDWLSAGRAQAAAIRAGEWWRCLTALCLHADLIHLAGNIVFGSAFAILLAQSVGTSRAWLGFVLAGGIGNYVNAWIQPASHSSIGASTGLFGALGVQVAFEGWRRRGFATGRLRRWAPIVAGVALLGFLGTGGASWSETDTPKERQVAIEQILERVDVLAHLTGFAAGLLIGLAFGLGRRVPPQKHIQAALAWAAPIALAIAWALALR